MTKNMLEDIKPSHKSNATVHIPIKVQGKGSTSTSPASSISGFSKPLPKEVPFEPAPSKHSPRYALWYLAAACVVAFLFSLSFLFEHANVTITAKSIPVAFDSSDTFTAQKDSTDPGTIVFTVMNLSGDESIKLPSTSSTNQSSAAKGRVVLYNAYTTGVYKLVKTTRLATPDGKIYRLDTAVAIPGYTKGPDGIVPGSAEATVTADAVGEASNIDHSDFSLPGLANSPQATKIYGRTKEPLTGGISGLVYSISQDAANAAIGTLQDKLKSSLLAKAKVQVPDGYDFFDGATSFVADGAVQAPYSKTPDVTLALHGKLTAYLIKENTLVQAIATKSVSQYGGEPVTIPKLTSLMLAPTGVLAPDTDTSFNFTLSGTANILWTIVPGDIQAMIAGKKKSDFNKILSSLVGVERAEVVLKPFWKQTFPTNIARITVVVN